MAGVSSKAPASATHALPGPQRYGRYILIDRLGAGGMAEVFRALVIGPERFQRMVVVKRILPHLSADPNFVRMFIDEATICGRLNHPNVIQVHEFGKVDDHYFIAMEYVHGRTLNAILGRLAGRGEYMPPTIAADIARQACQGLAYAHALATIDGRPLGVVHRDVTPSNVIVAYAGGVKVLDFGIARVAGEVRAGDTEAGKVKGKSSYLAPEQLQVNKDERGGEAGAPRPALDGRVDIFATGIILHEALCCRRLFKASGPVETMKLIRSAPIPPPSTLNPAVPLALDEIVMKALERDPARRFQSAGAMAEALEAYLVEARYASQELPRWLRGLFADEVTHEGEVTLPREAIAALMGEAEPEPAAPPAPRVATPAPLPVGAADAAVGAADVPGPPAPADPPARGAPGAAAPPRGTRARWPVLVGLPALGAAVAVAFTLRGAPERRPPLERVAAPTPAQASPAPARSPVDLAVAPAPAPAPAPSAEVQISIASEPEEAQVFRGEEAAPLGTTPVHVRIPRGGAPVEFRVVKPGYVAGSLKVVPDADKPALVTLARDSAARRPRGRGEADEAKEAKIRNALPLDPFAP
jgi:serine/threonine-protein kinase